MRRPQLGSRNFGRLWGATLVSNLGDGMRQTALPLLVAAATRDPGLVAATAFANRLPWLVFTPVAGALLDRYDRRRLMAFGNVGQAGAAAALVALIALSAPPYVVLLVAAAITGAIEVLVDNAEQVITPDIVEPDRLDAANGLIYGGFVTCNQLIGPALGAGLFGVAMAAPFASGAIAYVGAAILIFSIRGRFSPVPAAGDDRADTGLASGVRWLARHRTLLVLALTSGLQNVIATAGLAIAVLFALEVLGLPAYGFGLLLSVAAIGGLAGSVMAPVIARLAPMSVILVLANAVMAAALLAVGLATGAVVAGLALATVELASTVWNVLAIGIRQREVPSELLGRVNAAYRLIAWGGMPIGALAGGALASSIGLRAPFIVGGITLLGVSLVLLATLPRAASADPE